MSPLPFVPPPPSLSFSLSSLRPLHHRTHSRLRRLIHPRVLTHYALPRLRPPSASTASSSSCQPQPHVRSFPPPPRLAYNTAILASQDQRRAHSGHGHGHHHHHHGPDPYLTSKDKTDPGVRITRIGLYVNFAMAISKGVGGYVFNSQALVADAFHALTDMVSDVMTLATVSFAIKDPTSKFPNGYGKIESLGSLGVSALLLTAGLAMGYSSLLDLLHDFVPQIAAYLPHVHHHDHGIPDLNAAWLAGLSILLKEYLYRATMKIAVAKKSSVLASNAVHHRVDSLTAIVALLAIGGSNIWTSAGWLDPVGGLLVAGMVISAGGRNTMSALEELADKGIDAETKTDIRKKVEGVFSGGEEVRDVSGIKSGQNFLIHVVVAVRPDSTVAELREVEERVRGAAAGVRGVWRVDVKFVDRTSTESSSVFVNGKAKDGEKAG